MALKINKMEKETPLHPNVLLAQIVELEERDCAKINTTFGFITTNRLSKILKKSILFDISKETDFSKFCFYLLLIITNSK